MPMRWPKLKKKILRTQPSYTLKILICQKKVSYLTNYNLVMQMNFLIIQEHETENVFMMLDELFLAF